MPSHSLSKIRKRITQKKGQNPALHENSRNARRLRRATGREDRIATLSNIKAVRNQPLLDRMAYFQNRARERNGVFSVDDLHSTVNEYLSRNEDELYRVKAERRPGRPSSTREDHLAHNKDLEDKEYISGFWMPDLLDAKNLEVLATWNGEWGSLNPIKFCRLSKEGHLKTSKFPPDGNS